TVRAPWSLATTVCSAGVSTSGPAAATGRRAAVSVTSAGRKLRIARLAVGDIPQVLDRGVVPGNPQLVRRPRIERLRDEIDERAGVGQRPVTVGDAGRDPHEDVVTAAGGEDLGLPEGRGALADVEEYELGLGRRRNEPDVVLLEVVVQALDVALRVDDREVHLRDRDALEEFGEFPPPAAVRPPAIDPQQETPLVGDP